MDRGHVLALYEALICRDRGYSEGNLESQNPEGKREKIGGTPEEQIKQRNEKKVTLESSLEREGQSGLPGGAQKGD